MFRLFVCVIFRLFVFFLRDLFVFLRGVFSLFLFFSGRHFVISCGFISCFREALFRFFVLLHFFFSCGIIFIFSGGVISCFRVAYFAVKRRKCTNQPPFNETQLSQSGVKTVFNTIGPQPSGDQIVKSHNISIFIFLMLSCWISFVRAKCIVSDIKRPLT